VGLEEVSVAEACVAHTLGVPLDAYQPALRAEPTSTAPFPACLARG
jgi:hypothetical protein